MLDRDWLVILLGLLVLVLITLIISLYSIGGPPVPADLPDLEIEDVTGSP